jgi:hypothetical protein
MTQVKLDKLFMTEISGVDDPANQLPGWMVAKSATPTLADIRAAGVEVSDVRHSDRDLTLMQAERLRKIVGDDALFVSLIQGTTLLWNGCESQGLLGVSKASTTKAAPRHDGRKDVVTGKFHTLDRPAQVKSPDGIIWTKNDDRRSLAARAFGLGRKHPADDGTLSVTPYDGHPGDNAGRVNNS